eukprot:5393097-Ditylum_brightwellii.AAC.1
MAMAKKEANGSIAPEQFGGRVFHSAAIQALNVRMFYDQVKLTKIPATSTFIDLVSNYDLVVHSIASLALQWVGVPKAPIFCMLSSLQDMVQSVKTAYGNSLAQYGGDL